MLPGSQRLISGGGDVGGGRRQTPLLKIFLQTVGSNISDCEKNLSTLTRTKISPCFINTLRPRPFTIFKSIFAPVTTTSGVKLGYGCCFETMEAIRLSSGSPCSPRQ